MKPSDLTNVERISYDSHRRLMEEMHAKSQEDETSLRDYDRAVEWFESRWHMKFNPVEKTTVLGR